MGKALARALSLLVLAGLALLARPAVAQQQSVNCSPSTPCNTTSGPSNTSSGDTLWLSFGKLNANDTQLYGMFGSGTSLQMTGRASYGDIVGLWSSCSGTEALTNIGTCAAFGSVTSVGLTMPSGFTVSGSPVTGSGTLAVTTSLSGVLYGTGSGFGTASAADILGPFSGSCSAAMFARGDGACANALSGASASTVFTATSGNSATAIEPDLLVTRAGSTANARMEGPNACLQDTTNSTETCLQQSGGQTEVWQLVSGTWTQVGYFASNGGFVLSGATGGSQGVGTVNAQGVYVNGVAVGGSISPANPTGEVGPTAVNGSATTYMRSDAAPAFNESANYALTGNWVYSPSSGNALVVEGTGTYIGAVFNGATNQWTDQINGSTTASQSYGEVINAGTNSSDLALRVNNATASQVEFQVTGAGMTQIMDSAGSLFNAGYLGLPATQQSTNYTLALKDRGKSLQVGTTGLTYTVPESVFSPGDVVTIANLNSGVTATIAAGTGVTLYWAGTQSTGNRTLTGYGYAVIFFYSATAVFVSGPGVS